MLGTRRNLSRWTVAALSSLASLVALTTPVEAQPPTGGPEFQVNVYTYYRQDRPKVSISDDGAFVVVWTSEKQDGALDGVFARRYDAGGTAVGGDIQVSLSTAGVQNNPNVALEDDGDFVVVWRSGADTASGEIFARRFNSAGAPQGSLFQVNTYTPELQHLPAVAIDGDGDFLVSWTSERQDGSTGDDELRNGGVFARRFNSSGVALAAEFQVNTYTPHGQHDPVIAMRADGFFVITWASRNQDEDPVEPTSHDGVFAQLYSSTGAPIAVEFQVNTYTVSYQHHQAIGMDAEGDFVIAWHSNQIPGYAGMGSDVFLKRFNSSGSAIGGELQVNTFTPSFQEDIGVSMEPDGDFVVVWDSKTGDGDAYGVFGKRFNSAAVAQSADFQINTFTPGYQNRPSVTRAVGESTFVVVWQSGGAQDGYGYGIFAKRFGVQPAGPVLDVDGDGVTDPLTDGLLILRWAFSFTGTTLVNGATGMECERCTGEEVKTYLDGVITQLDIDGSGETEPLSDGLLALRYLFSFTGATLIGGATEDDCTRCTAPLIEDYLESLDG